MYSKLSKEEKKDLRKKYNKTKKGSVLSVRLNRLAGEGLFCIVTFLITVISTLVYHLEWWYWAFAAGMLLAGFFFLIGQHKIRMKEYNNFCMYIKRKK